MRNRFVVLLLLLISFSARAQEVTIRAGFQQDSVRIGAPVYYYLVATYPSQYQVLFPDSTFSFSPFEFEQKTFYPTKTQNNISYDSTVYTLVSFEIDPLQMLALPVFQVQKQDSLVYHPQADTIFFSAQVPDMPDSLAISQLPLKTNTDYTKVSWILNYPVLLIIAGILLVIIIVVWIVFGKKIRRHFKVKRLAKKHAAFLSSYNQAVAKLNQSFNPDAAETSLTIWKKYMEELLARPYTKYTSKEIREIEKGELTLPLQAIDKMIYARLQPEDFAAFTQLKEFTENRFNQKLQEVKHG